MNPEKRGLWDGTVARGMHQLRTMPDRHDPHRINFHLVEEPIGLHDYLAKRCASMHWCLGASVDSGDDTAAAARSSRAKLIHRKDSTRRSSAAALIHDLPLAESRAKHITGRLPAPLDLGRVGRDHLDGGRDPT